MITGRRSPTFGLFGRLLMRDLVLHMMIASSVGVTLFLVIDFVEVGNRAKDTATAQDFALLSLYSIPTTLKLILPVTVPMGALTAVSAQMRTLELAAFLAAGASIWALIKPILVAASIAAGLYIGIVEYLIPPSSEHANTVRRKMGLPYSNTMWGRSGWYKGRRQLYRIENIRRGDASELQGIVMLKIEKGAVVKRVDVQRMKFEDGKWIGQNVIERKMDAQASSSKAPSMKTRHLPKTELDVPEQPQDFNVGLALPKRLNYKTLKTSMNIREKLGRPAISHRLEYYHRHTGPLSVILAALLASAIGLRRGRRQTLAAALGWGSALGFSIWLMHELMNLVGGTGALPSLFVASLMPLLLIVGALGAWYQVQTRGIRES